MPKLRVAMIGLGFGAEFIPIYQRHPQAEVVAVCRRNEAEMNKIADAFSIPKRYADYGQVLSDPDIDFVHINSPIPDHAWMSMEALQAGKHVMCTVPMATTVADCEKICQARRRYRPQIHDGRNRGLQPRVLVHQGDVPEGRVRQDPISRKHRTRRTWTAGPTTGNA